MKNNNWSKNVKDSYNQKRAPRDNSDRPIITGCKVEVRNGDVNGAIRRLKKILERDNRQKELSKREFYEKPSRKRKRRADAAKARWQRDVEQSRRSGEWRDTVNSNNTSWQKTKRKRRKHVELMKKISSRSRG